MNLFRDIRKRRIYDYLSTFNDDELKNIFYVSSILLKERKNKNRIYEYLLNKKENKNE